MTLLEREHELTEVAAALAATKAGQGHALGIEATAGLGKTRLLQEARQLAADADLRVFTARATELERDFPFSLVRQLFAPALATVEPAQREVLLEGAGAASGALGLEEADDRTHDPFAVLHGLYWVTAAWAELGPLLLAVDDLHWADPASLDYLAFLLPRLEELPILLIVTSRQDEPNPPEGLGRVLADPAVRQLTPKPLSPEATTALLELELGRAPAPGFAAACHEVSGGNPFLLCELTRALASRGIDPVAEQADAARTLAPDRVARTVLARLGRHSETAGAAARSVAVLGDDCELALVADLADLDHEAAREAVDALHASAIFDPGASLRFIHPLVRNAVYAEIPVAERAWAHARAAELLRDRGASPERIATQLLAAEARGQRATVETLLAAGERALATGAPQSAAAYLARAWREPPSPDLRATVLEQLIAAGVRATDHATLAAIEADVFAELERDPSLRSRWANDLTMWMTLTGRFELAASLLAEAAEAAIAEGDLEGAFRMEAELRTIALMVPSAPKVELALDPSLIEPDSAAGRLAAAMEVRWAVVNGTAEEAAGAAKRALANDGIIFAEEPELVASFVAVMALVVADELDAARQGVERALAIARERNATPALVRARFLSGFVAWGFSDLAGAEEDLRQAHELARQAGIGPGVMLTTGPLMEILIERDQLDAAEAELQKIGMASGPLPASALFSMVLLIRGHLRFERGELPEAVEDFLALSAQAKGLGLGPGPFISAAPFAARALVAVGDASRALELSEEMMGYAERWGTPTLIAHVLRAIAVARGGAEEVELLEQAVDLLRRSPRRLEYGRALVDLGAALRRSRRRADSREPLREGLELARRCGGTRIARRAADELRASGEKVRRYTPIGVESLTPSERRAAELAASGLSNRQIAQTLFVTVKTVEAHLGAAYDKLDIHTRQELPGVLGETSVTQDSSR